MMTSTMQDHIVLVGLGKVGYRTYSLLRRLGEQIAVIEIDPKNPFLERVRRDGHAFFVGDGRRDELLKDANVQRARSVIAATDDDLANLEIALDSRRLNDDVRVVLRLFDQALADKIREGFDIHLAMSPSAMSAPNFAMAAVDPTILSSFVLDQQLIVMLRWQVLDGGPLCGRTVAQLQSELGFGVTQYRPREGGSRLFPPAETVLRPGDEVLVQGPYDELVALKSGRMAERVPSSAPEAPLAR